MPAIHTVKLASTTLILSTLFHASCCGTADERYLSLFDTAAHETEHDKEQVLADCAPRDTAIIPPELPDIDSIDRHFGNINQQSFVLEDMTDPPRQVSELHWIEAAWNKYDIDITTLPDIDSHLASEKAVAGILVTKDAAESLYGIRLGDVITFVDAEGALGDAAVPSNWDTDARMIRASNQMDSLASFPPAEVMLAHNGIEIRLHLSPSARDRLGIDDLSNQKLREANASAHGQLSSGIWTGGMREKDPSSGDTIFHARLNTLELKRDSNHPEVVVGILSQQHAVRRLDGPVPEGSPWQDRLALSNALYQLEMADFAWWDPWTDTNSETDFNERITDLAGRPFTKKDLHALIVEMYGSIETGTQLTCRFPESTHFSVSLLGSEGHRCFSGLKFSRPQNIDDQRMQMRYYLQTGVPSDDGAWSAIDHNGVNPGLKNFMDNKNTLWLRSLNVKPDGSSLKSEQMPEGQQIKMDETP
jgi:hypothetical protein